MPSLRLFVIIALMIAPAIARTDCDDVSGEIDRIIAEVVDGVSAPLSRMEIKRGATTLGFEGENALLKLGTDDGPALSLKVGDMVEITVANGTKYKNTVTAIKKGDYPEIELNSGRTIEFDGSELDNPKDIKQIEKLEAPKTAAAVPRPAAAAPQIPPKPSTPITWRHKAGESPLEAQDLSKMPVDNNVAHRVTYVESGSGAPRAEWGHWVRNPKTGRAELHAGNKVLDLNDPAKFRNIESRPMEGGGQARKFDLVSARSSPNSYSQQIQAAEKQLAALPENAPIKFEFETPPVWARGQKSWDVTYGKYLGDGRFEVNFRTGGTQTIRIDDLTQVEIDRSFNLSNTAFRRP